MTTMHRSTLALLLTVLAPSLAFAQTSTLQPFSLSGKGYIQGRGEAQRRLPNVESIGVQDTNIGAYDIGAQLVSSVDAPTREMRYSGQVTRDISGTLVDYRFSTWPYNWSTGGRLPRLSYQNGKKFAEALPGFTAPATGDITRDVAFTDLCSLTVALEGQVAGEDITYVSALATSGNWYDVTNAENSYGLAEFGNQVTTGAPKDLSAFLSTTSAGRETGSVEMLVRLGRTYTVSGSVVFSNDGKVIAALNTATITLTDANCTNATVTLPVRRPQEKINGSIWLKRDNAYASGPSVSRYDVQIYGQTIPGNATTFAIHTGLVPVGDAAVNYTAQAARARYTSASNTGISLTWPDGRTGNLYLPTTGSFWSPVATSATKRGVYPDGSIVVDPDEIESASFAADMAFLVGTTSMTGCAALADVDKTQSWASMSGQSVAGATFVDELGTTRTAQTGLANSGSSTAFDTGTGEYELVGMPGPWKETYAYFTFKRPGTGPSLDGFTNALLNYSYQNSPLLNLVAKRANAVTASHAMRFGNVVVTMRVTNPDGTLRPFHSPVLTINNANEFNTATPPAVIGTYSVTARGLTTPATTHKVVVIAPPSTATITGTAMVPPNADGTGTPNSTTFPPLPNVPFRAPRADGTCAATCAVFGGGAWSYYNDDTRNPVLAVDTLPATTRSATINVTGTVSDESPSDITVKGVAATVTGTAPSQSWSSSVALAIGDNNIDVVVNDRCGGTTTKTVTVKRLANNVPTLTVPGTQTVTEGTAVSFSVTGADADGDTLTYSYSSSPAITGAVLNTATGAFSIPGANVVVGTYTLTFGVTDGTDSAPTKTVTLNVTPRVPTKLAFTVQPQTTVAGATMAQVKVSLLDAGNVVCTSATNSITLAIGTNPSSGTLGGTKTVAAVAGVATFSTLTVDKAGVGYTLAASSSGLTGTTSTAFDITAGAASKLAFTVQPSNVASGAVMAPAVKVSVLDANGNLTASTATITLAFGTNPSTGTLGGTKSAAAVAGVASFADLTVDKAGVGYTLVASATSLTSATSNAFNVTAGAPSKLDFTVQPSNVVSGATMAPAVKVAILDANGNLTASTANVTLAIGTNPSAGTLGGTKTVAAIAGVAMFADLTVDKAGTGYTLVASSPSLTNATSSAFNVTAGAASKLAFSVQPSNTASGVAIAPAVKVSVLDANGNVTASTASITLAFGTNPSTATLGGTKTAAAVAGVATFSNLTVDKVGTGYTLVATAASLANATSNAFNVTGGTATKLAFTVQPSNVTAGATMAPAVKVSILDAAGNVTASTASITLAFGTNPSSGTLGGTKTVAAVAGVATFSNLSVNKTGTGYTLVAAGPSLTSATSNAFNVTAGAGASLVFTVQPSDVASAAAIAPAVKVSVLDANGNLTASTASISLAFGANPSSGVLSGTATVPAVAGVATFPDLTVDKAGVDYTLVASGTSLTSATSTPFDVTAGAAAKLAFAVQPSNTIAGEAIAPAVEVVVQDAAGNTVTTATNAIALALEANPGSDTLDGTVTANAVNGLATFATLSLDRAATGYSLTATSEDLASTTSTLFDILAATPDHLSFKQDPTDTRVHESIAPPVRVAVLDRFDNLVPDATDDITLSIGNVQTEGTELSGGITQGAVAGIATFPDLSVNLGAVDLTLSASTSSEIASAESAPFDVLDAAPLLVLADEETVPEGTLLEFPISATDDDGDTVTLAASNLPEGASFDPLTGLFSWTPDFESAGDYTVSVEASANGISTMGTVVVHVLDVNRPPVVDAVVAEPAHQVGPFELTIVETNALDFTIEGFDPDVDATTIALTMKDGGALPEGISLDTGTGAVAWTPTYEQAGDYTFMATVSDGRGGTGTKEFVIHVVDLNRPPVLAPIGAKTVKETETLVFGTPATDPDGDTLIYTAQLVDADGLPRGAVYDATGPSFTWTPDRQQAGPYTVRVQVRDGRGGEDVEDVVITVTNANRPPAFDPVADIETDGPGGFGFVVTDPDGDPLTCTAVTLPPDTAIDAEHRTIDWADGINTAGHYVATIRCSDGELDATLDVNIHARVFDRVGGGLAGCGCDASGTTSIFGLAALALALRRRRQSR